MKDIFIKGVKIKIIGDSIAAGAGSSMSYLTDEPIFEEDGMKFFKRAAPNSWWGLFERYLKVNYGFCAVENKGCGGAFSYQINRNLETLISADDDLVFVLMGLNDRKRINGMEELRDNCASAADKLLEKGKTCCIDIPESFGLRQ